MDGSVRAARQSAIAPSLIPVLLIGVAIWTLLVSKLWKRPRKWSIGIGVFMVLMGAFQIALYILGTRKFGTQNFGIAGYPIVFALEEVPIFFTAACCFMLRASYSNPGPD